MTETTELYFAGERLLGDDFGPDQIESWYADEAEGYAELGASDAARYRYSYHALNQYHGFRFLPDRRFERALGFGSAYGDEFAPIADRIGELAILDPSDAFVRERVHGIPTTYRKPAPSGLIPYPDGEFDLISCLGVLHHIPNVSTVVGELARVLDADGWCLLREPIVSLGDWRYPRRGLTRRERGIPLPILRRIIAEAGFSVVSERLCAFPLIPRLWRPLRRPAYNSPIATRLDHWAATLLRWHIPYHATTPLQKVRPSSAYYVLRHAAT